MIFLPFKHIVISLLTLTLIIGVIPTQIGKRGGTLPLAPNLNILVVREGIFNPLLYASELLGVRILGDGSNDRYLQNLNAYGLATHYLKGQSPNGLYLSQRKGTKGINNRLKSGDVIKRIKFAQGCLPKYKGLQAAWVHTAKCSSELTIFRNQQFHNVSFLAKEGDSFTAIRILSDQAPKSPKILNQITGLSAGLILSLYYLDQRSKGSLIAKEVVSGSGMIELGSYSYTAISDLPEKYLAASRAKSTVLFLAKDQSLSALYANKIKLDSNMEIFKVKNLDEIVKILCRRGAKDELCVKGY